MRKAGLSVLVAGLLAACGGGGGGGGVPELAPAERVVPPPASQVSPQLEEIVPIPEHFAREIHGMGVV